MASAVTSIYNNVISAASAGFAPTNSADVSAIASAYQVVSATATQLYAGTAYLTSVNDNPLSASRAGQAANASMANSAYYDGTGRLISALPDSATVSAIASSYAESAASSKQDTLTFGYNTADQISSIDGSALGGMDEAAVSAIASAYAESAVSSVSSNYYTTANESGYALSSDVSATVDLVGTQSANWGGSALALSAGPGVKLEKVGDTLVASTDETLLWSGSGSAFTTTEPLTNFSEIKFHIKSHASANVGESVVPMIDNNRTAIKLSWTDDWSKDGTWLGGLQWWSNLNNTGMTGFSVVNTYYIGLRSGLTFGGGSYGTNIYVLDVIGVGRTAEA